MQCIALTCLSFCQELRLWISITKTSPGTSIPNIWRCWNTWRFAFDCLFAINVCKVSSFLLLGQWSKECASLRHLLKEPNCLKVRSMRSCLCVYCFSFKSFLLQGPHRESEAKQSTPEVKKFYLWYEELMRKRKLAITSPKKCTHT